MNGLDKRIEQEKMRVQISRLAEQRMNEWETGRLNATSKHSIIKEQRKRECKAARDAINQLINEINDLPIA